MLAPVPTDQAWFLWGAVLVLGFPVVVVLLGEVVTRLQRGGSPLARPVTLARNVLLPTLVVLLFIRFVLERGAADTVVRVPATVVWMLALVIVLSAISAYVFAAADPNSWRGRAPRLFVDIARIVLIAVGAAIIVGAVWGVNLVGLFAALGVGGVVIGLALQDTLASLLGGIALLSEKPFTVGDWIDMGDGTAGVVTDINWRTVRLRTRGEDLIVVPNIVFGTTTVVNNSRPSIDSVELVPLGFSYDDPPTLVHRVLLAVARDTPGVLDDPPPRIRTVGYGDSSIDYEARLHLESFDTMPDVRSDFLTRVWYAARRHGLTIPFPIRTVHRLDGDAMARAGADAAAELRDRGLRMLSLPAGELDRVAADAHVEDFAAGEHLQREQEVTAGLRIVVAGTAVATVRDEAGDPIELFDLGPGELFGEVSALGVAPNRLTVRAVTDVRVVVVAPSAARDLARRNERLAGRIERTLQSRRVAADDARRAAAERARRAAAERARVAAAATGQPAPEPGPGPGKGAHADGEPADEAPRSDDPPATAPSGGGGGRP